MKSLKAQYTAACARREKANMAVYDWAIANGHGALRGSEVAKIAPPKLVAAQESAYEQCQSIALRAVNTHKAYWSGSHPIFYR